ncbi:4Fe-4S binding protein [Clostridium sp. SHJSY1]|uniref:4Fe-4S dicluster domain-containing protein n=1 Tax=Clostridium sp. SHJSY1 TaxID=2942483 RepID=UPI0028767D07|nr:4Fe-4S dicluster domain-containing protein [Clostridium sp. SHJSY1]MDS0525177.1 4Fe-4S binding protein [Clostridium sp. SHJSY1]
MENEKKKVIRKKAQVLKNQCVACGTCIKECPISAIKVVQGVFAEVDQTRCVGCGKCERACPASVIEIIAKEEVK